LATAHEHPPDFSNPTIEVPVEGDRTRTIQRKEFICQICKDDLEGGEHIITHIECNQDYHVHCISQWIFGLNRTCPICRILLFL
jgi:hypothetical protein